MPYQTLILTPLDGGLRLDLPPAALPDPFSPRIQNVRIRNAIVGKRPGQTLFNSGSLPLGTSNSGIVSAVEYRRETGTVETLVILGGAAAGDRDIFKSAGGAWTSIKGALVMQGSTTEPYDWAIAPRQGGSPQIDVLYMSNGQGNAATPKIISWPGSGNVAAMDNAPGAPRYLASFTNRLVIGYLFDSTAGAFHGNRIAWSAFGDAETWNVASSGQADLTDTSDLITRLYPLKGRLIIYKQRSIFIGRATGLDTVPIGFTLFTKDMGSPAGFTVAGAAGSAHFFLGLDNVYMFDGSSVVPIGEPIRRDLMKNLNQQQPRQPFGMVNEFFSEYWLFVPEGDETFPKHAWVYNYRENHWNRWEFLTALTCGTRTPSSSAPTWGTSTGTWGSHATDTWSSVSSQGSNIYMLGDASRNTQQADDVNFNDSSTLPIDAFYESRDVDFSGQFDYTGGTPYTRRTIATSDLKTLVRIVVRVRAPGTSTTLNCELSTDGGLSFQSVAPAPNTVSANGGVVYYDVWQTATRFRIRLRNNTLSQALPPLEALELHYIPRNITV